MNNPNRNNRNRQNAQNRQQNPTYGRPQNPNYGYGYNGQNPYGQPPPNPEYLRRRREIERKQAEARIQIQRDNERRAKQRRKMEKKRRFRQNMRILGGRLLVFAVILVIMCVIAGALFLLFFNHTPDEPETSGNITYYCGGSKTRIASVADAVADNVVYICFNDVAQYLGMSESGSAEAMKFILPMSDTTPADSSGTGDEEYISFMVGGTDVDINGQIVQFDIPNVIHGTEVWVSSNFIAQYMNNLSCVYNEKKSEVNISRIKDEENSTDDAVVYLPVSFKLKKADALDPIPEDEALGSVTKPKKDDAAIDSDVAPDDTVTGQVTEEDALPYSMDELNFLTDLSAYEKYMEPEDRDGFLRLVNTVNLISESELPDDLVDCKYTAAAKTTQKLRLYAEMALEALFQEMQAAGYNGMAVYSGYRSLSYQTTLFEKYTENEMAANPSLSREEAEKIVLTYSTRPGTSEHHTGLAVDMDTLGTFTTDFAYTKEYAWLSENAWKFGFILRFPADKTEITTIQFEPWHYRYVGRYHAKKIYDSGLCLEEYVEQLAQSAL